MTDVYVAKTDIFKDPHMFQHCYDAAPVFRKEKIDRLQNTEKKRASLGAWVLLSYALKQAGISCDDMHLGFTKAGKPYLADVPHVHFNLSHSGDTVLCAVSGSEVGCDAEQVRRIDLKLANRFFSPSERDIIKSQKSPKAQEQMFFRLWTLKESFIKMAGQTLSALPDFSITLTDEEICAEQQLVKDKDFYFKEFSLDDGYCYACCAGQNGFSELMLVNLKEAVAK